MTKRKRFAFIFILGIFFVITSVFTVLYSMGWRFDLKNFRFKPTGIFYFKVYPKNVKIFLNNKEKAKTDFLFGSAMIENLTPGKYKVEIKKQGYHTWEKTLEIKERMPTEAKNIVLFSKDPEFKSLFSKSKQVFFSENREKVIIKEESEDKEKWELKLFDLNRLIKSHLLSSKDLELNLKKFFSYQRKIYLADLKFGPDQKRILIKTEIRNKSNNSLFSEKYFLINIENTPPQITSLDFLEKPEIKIEKIDFNPFNKEKLLILYQNVSSNKKSLQKSKKLSEADITKEKILPPVAEKIIDYSFFEDNFYQFDESGIVFKSDINLSKKEQITPSPFPLKKNFSYQITASKTTFFIKEDNSLYFFNPKTKKFQQIEEPINLWALSNDLSKIIYNSGNKIYLFFLQEKKDPPFKKAHEKVLILESDKKINQIVWLNDYYFLFEENGNIKIGETDFRDKINIIQIADFKNPEIIWDKNKKVLYVFSENTLFVSKKLLP